MAYIYNNSGNIWIGMALCVYGSFVYFFDDSFELENTCMQLGSKTKNKTR
mgnify:CR=1 FL=1